MRNSVLLALAIALLGGPAWAQSVRGQETGQRPADSVPVDHGPFTPEASRAYQGGGVILQGAPGAPAPVPQATPPGQRPKNMVPPG